MSETADPADYSYGDLPRYNGVAVIPNAGPEETTCRTCGRLAMDHTPGRFSIHGICPDLPTCPCDYWLGVNGPAAKPECPHHWPQTLPQQHQLDGTKRPAALLHVETDVDVVLDALARWHGEQPTYAHPGCFDLCPASPCRDVREAL